MKAAASRVLQIGGRAWRNPGVLASVKTFARPEWHTSHQDIGRQLDAALVAARGENYLERQWLRDLFAGPGMRSRHMLWSQALAPRGEAAAATGGPNDYGRFQGDMKTRTFVEAGALLREASDRALRAAEVRPEEVARLVTSTEIVFPTGVDEQSHFTPAFSGTRRIHITGHGCVSGVVALRDSLDFLRGHPEAVVQTGATEISSQWIFSGFRYLLRAVDTRDKNSFRLDAVMMLLFGDLAASSVLLGAAHPNFERAAAGALGGREAAGGLVLVDSETYNLPTAHTLLGADRVVSASHEEFGPRGIITRDVPSVGGPIALRMVEALLQRNGLQTAQVKSLLVHPGGRKVLDTIAEAAGRGGRDGDDPRFLESSYHTLEHYGNCIGATIYQVVAHELAARPIASLDPREGPEPVVLVGMGLGMSFEAILAYRFPPGCRLQWKADADLS